MIKIIYLFGVLLGSLTTLHAVEVFAKTSTNSEPGFAVEWIGLIVLALTGLIFIYRSARQIKKIRKLQEELDTFQSTVTHELDTIGGKNA